MTMRDYVEERHPALTAILDAELWFWEDVEEGFTQANKHMEAEAYEHGYEEGRTAGYREYEQMDAEEDVAATLMEKEMAE